MTLSRIRKSFIANHSVPTPKGPIALGFGDTDSGLLPPRLTTAQRNALIPLMTDALIGMVIYNASLGHLEQWFGSRFGWTPLSTKTAFAISTGGDFSLAQIHNGLSLTATDSFGTMTCTIPGGLSPNFSCELTQTGPSTITFTTSGTTIQSAKGVTTTGVGALVRITCYGVDNVFVLSGDLTT